MIWPGRPLVAVPQEVATAQLDRVDLELAGDLVHVLLEGPGDGRRARGADGARGLGVRVHAQAEEVDVRDAVRPREEHHGELGDQRLVGRVGPVLRHHAAAAGDDRPVAHDAGLELDDHRLAAMVRCQEFLASREDDLDGPAGGTGERRDLGLEMALALGPEAAAHVGHRDPDPVLGQLQRLGHERSGGERNLRRRPDRDLVATPLGDDGPRLDRRALGAIRHEAARDDDVRARHRRVRVALDDGRSRGFVAITDDALVDLVVGPALVDERRVRGQRRVQVRDHRQGLVVDLDQVGRLARDRRRQRGHGRDDLALPADHVLREQRAILDEEPVADVGHVGGRDDRHDPGQGLRLRGVESADPGVADVRVPEAAVQEAGHVEVGRIAADARDLFLAVEPDGRRHGSPPVRLVRRNRS